MSDTQVIPESNIESPEEFPFPFEPYDIQTQFMKALFKALVDKSLGIFESPTGTGKSLSMLCGALTWLEKHEAQRVQDLKAFIGSIDIEKEDEKARDCEDWIKAQSEVLKKKDSVCKAKRELNFLQQMIEKREKIIQSRHKILKSKNSSFFRPSSSSSHNNSDTGILNGKSSSKGDKGGDENELFDDILFDDFALNNYSDSDFSEDEESPEVEFHAPKIIFASRTHTQLSQFAKELKRTPFADRVTTVTLGSRQNLCINSEVSRLKNLSLINEKCLDLQKGSKGKKVKADGKKLKTCQGCPYYKSNAIEDLKNHILAEPIDIEELVRVAKTEIKACPYYASRKASKEAQLILLPYNTVLHSGTRDGVGIQTENSVLLLDEAHNIIESISNMYSNSITLSQLKDCFSALEAYIKRYMTRFSTDNLLKLKQIKFIVRALVKFLETSGGLKNDNGQLDNIDELYPSNKNLYTIQEFKNTIDIGEHDLYSLLKFCKKSHLIFKLKGYMLQQQKLALVNSTPGNTATAPSPTIQLNKRSQGKGKNSLKKNNSDSNSKQDVEPPSVKSRIDTNQTENFTSKPNSQAILNLSEFLKSLKTCDAEGRIIIDRDQKSYKFLLLNVAPQFQDLIRCTRSIILAGGTMKPYDEITDHLFKGSLKPIASFSCNHVIPDDNLICLALTKGPKNNVFDFTFKNRKSPELMEELTQTLTNVIKIVPGGVVCFLPSYEYEGIFYKFLQDKGAFENLNGKKRIFREPKDGNCDLVLTDYSRQIRNNPNGALLFAVVGGKLSEGINFSDDLGRCVIVVGLPFPNVTSVEIQEKVKYATSCFNKEKGDALLTNMCSKAVNQSVGRAIRHANDYAAILLIDQRFARTSQQALLPGWIQQRSSVCHNFGSAIGALGKFFSNKRRLSASTP